MWGWGKNKGSVRDKFCVITLIPRPFSHNGRRGKTKNTKANPLLLMWEKG